MATNPSAAALDGSAAPVPESGHEHQKQTKQTIDPYNVCGLETLQRK